MRGLSAGAREPLQAAAPAKRFDDGASAVVKLLQHEAPGNPEAAEKEEAEKRSKHVRSSLFRVGAGRTAALLGRTNVPILFSLVKSAFHPICK
jgi:hypothetical protein